MSLSILVMFRVAVVRGWPWRADRRAGGGRSRPVLKSWTHPLGADPGPALIELNLGTAAERTDLCVEATPAEARAIARALVDLADTAERGARPGAPG